MYSQRGGARGGRGFVPRFNGYNQQEFKVDLETQTNKKIVAQVVIKGVSNAQPVQRFKEKLEAAASIKQKCFDAVYGILKANKNAKANIYQPYYYNLKFKFEAGAQQIFMIHDGGEPQPVDSVKTVKEAEAFASALIKAIADPAVKQWDIDSNPKIKALLEELEEEFKTPPKQKDPFEEELRELMLEDEEANDEALQLAELVKAAAEPAEAAVPVPEEGNL